jgi:nucleoid-associated protein YgaU
MKWVDTAYSLVCLLIPPFGDLMNKSGTLISSALLTFAFAAAAMAADMPKAAAPMAADAPAAAAPAADSSKPAAKKKSSKKHKKAAAAAAPATK